MDTQETDKLQLVNPAMIRRIVDLYGTGDADAAWAFTLENLETLKTLAKCDSAYIIVLNRGLDHVEEAFYRFYDQDDELVLQWLINDLGFLGESVAINYWARCGYLDHASSVDVLTSRTLIPGWGDYSEAPAYARRFDIINAQQVGLMTAALEKHRAEIDPTIFTAQMQALSSLVSILTSQSCDKLGVAYIYQTS